MLKNTGERLILEQSWNLMTTMEHVHRYNAASLLADGKVVLDAACGTGYGSYYLSKRAKKVYGIDLSEDAVSYAKERYDSPNLQYLVMSVDDLQFEDDFFDMITSFETIEHITKEQQVAFLNGIKRKLKRDGMLIISTPNDQLLRDISFGNYVNEFHICEFNEQEYIEFLQQYFKYVKIYYQTVTEVSAIVKKDNGEGQGPIFSLTDKNEMGRYYVAVCSDQPISENITLESALLPNPQEYFDEAYFKKQAMLFVDDGNGYKDENKIICEYITRDGVSFECSFDLSEYNNIKTLRFDPCEHGGLIVLEKVIDEKGNNLSVQPLNACGKKDGFDEFMTFDPQYCINDTRMIDGIQSVTIQGKVNKVPDHVIIAREKAEIDKKNAEINSLNDIVNQGKTEKKDLQEEVQRLNDVVGQVSVESGKVVKEVQRLNDVITQITTEREDLVAEVQRLNNAITQMSTEREDLVAEVQRLNDVIAQVSTERGDLVTEVQRLNDVIAQVSSERGDLVAEVQRLNDVITELNEKRR